MALSKLDSTALGILSGNISFASGQGIDFSATSDGSGTTTSELLDEYEEGTYTATLTCNASGTITLQSSNQTLTYTKTGRVVFISGRIHVDSVSSPTGSIFLNLPFTSATGGNEMRFQGFCLIQNASSNANDFFIGPQVANSSQCQIFKNAFAIVDSEFSGDELVSVSFSYITT